MTDLVLKGGQVIDPARNLRAQLDVAVTDGAISQVAPNISQDEASRVVDVAGKLVVPGLIDLHTHIYEGMYHSGVNPDLVGVRAGVTTLVDGGTSGCYTFGGFPRYVIPQTKTRIICMLHITRTGIMIQPELSRREDIDLDETIRVVNANKPLIQGIKLRAVGPAVPTMGVEMMHLAKKAANEAGVRLMVHIGDPNAGNGPTITREVLSLMEPGDIVTHLFTGNPGQIVDENGKVVPEIIEAQERGVFMDTAFGRFNFSFDVAKRSLDQGVVPEGISTDITAPGRRNTVHSLTEMLSRFLALGFSLEDVIGMATVNPARALGMEDTLGSLEAGRDADITVLEEVTGDWVFKDTCGGTLNFEKALVPVVTVKGGEVFSPDWGPRPWGWLPDSAS